jgi:hypothetical protein
MLNNALLLSPACNQFTFNWLLFGSAYKDVDDLASTTIAQYTRSDAHFNPLVKCLARVCAISGPTSNPHFFTMRDHVPFNVTHSERHAGATFEDVHVFQPKHLPHTCALPRASTEGCDKTQFCLKAPAYIAHYSVQAYDVYLARKVRLPRDDTGAYRPECTPDDLHAQSNAILNDAVEKQYGEIVKRGIVYLAAHNATSTSSTHAP